MYAYHAKRDNTVKHEWEIAAAIYVCATIQGFAFPTSLTMIPKTEIHIHDCRVYMTDNHRNQLKHRHLEIHDSPTRITIVCAIDIKNVQTKILKNPKNVKTWQKLKKRLQTLNNKRLCYCRETARRATSVEILWPFFD